MILIVAAISFLSAFVQAASGFGYAIVAMYFMPMFLPFGQCSVISAAVIVIIALQMTISLHKHIKFKKIAVPMIFCLATTGVGVWIIRVVDESIARKTMGVFLMLLAVYFYLTKKYKVSLKLNFVNGMIIGILTGLTTGMFNIVGPFLMLYYYDNCEDNLEFKGNIEFSYLVASIFSLCLNIYFTGMSVFLAANIVAAGVAAVLAGILGLKVFYKIDKERLKYVITCALPIMGLVQLIK